LGNSPVATPSAHVRRRARATSTLRAGLVAAILLALPSVAAAQDKDKDKDKDKARTTAVEFASLRLLREKGVISQAEYDRAIADIGQTTGLRAADSATLVLGSVSTTVYGFIEVHGMYDTTQSFGDSPNNAQVARPGTFAGENERLQFSVRDTRLGFRFKGPDITPAIHTSATLEMDFFAPLPGGVSEAATFDNAPLRVRHAWFKLETPIVDLVVGQAWDLFGWQPFYVVPSIQYSGVPGNLFGRTPQVRVSKKITLGGAVTVESAIAALRSPQRDAAVPEGQIGLRISLDKWTGVQTIYTSTTLLSPASIAVSGAVRKLAVKEWSAAPTPTNENVAIGKGIAVSAFLPILTATKDDKSNSLAIHGEFVTGEGIADLYTGLVGGVDHAPLPNPNGMTPAPTFTPNIDPGIAVYDASGKLHPVQWTTFIVGAQYSLPGLNGKAFIAGNYARTTSSNARQLGAPAKVREREEWFNVALWVDPAKPLRFGAEYASFNDKYADGVHAKNHRVDVSAFWFF
jgi:hypothetical protein